MKLRYYLFFLSLTLLVSSCGNDDSQVCEGFSLAPCDVSDATELALVEAMLLDQASSSYAIQLAQRTGRYSFAESFAWSMQECGFEVDTNAMNRLLEINASAHNWCTDLINFNNIIGEEEFKCLFGNNGENLHALKYPNTRTYTYSRPVVDKFGRAYISFNDGCTGYDAILELNQGNWEVICTGLVWIC